MTLLDNFGAHWSDEMKFLHLILRVHFKICDASSLLPFLDKHQVNMLNLLTSIKKQKLIPIALGVFKQVKLGEHYPSFMNRIIQQAMRQNKHRARLLKEQQRLTQCFKDAKIKSIPYKGPGFVSQFYVEHQRRFWVDIDIAIAREDIPKAAQLLFDLGYVEHKNKTDFDNIHKSRGYEIDFSFILKENNRIISNVELHWQPSHNVLYFPMSFEDILSKTVVVSYADYSFDTFEKEYHALIILVHHGLVDCWGKLRHLIDLYYITQAFSAQEAQSFSGLLSKYGLRKTYSIGQALINELLYGPKSEFETKYLSEKSLDSFFNKIMQNALNGNWSENPSKLKLHLSMRDTFKDKMKVTFSIIRYYLKFHLPKRLFTNG